MYIRFHVNDCQILMEIETSRFSKNTQISDCMKIRPAGPEFFHAKGRTDRQTDRHDEANIRSKQVCERP